MRTPKSGFGTLSEPVPRARILSRKPWKTLLILVDFPDQPRKGSAAYFKNMLFAHRSLAEAEAALYPTESMADLYARMSHGAVTFGEVTVVDWFQAPHPYTYYTRFDNTANFSGCFGLGPSGDFENGGIIPLMQVALSQAVAEGVDLNVFNNIVDSDGVQEPDGIFVVHAGPGAEYTSETKECLDGGDIWSHQFYSGFNGKPHHYLMGPAESVATQSVTGLSPAGVWAHEFGHMLELHDLYETSQPRKGFGVGCWDLMGYGISSCWPEGFVGDEPGHDPQEMSVWSRTELEWASPRKVTDNVCNRLIDPVAYGGETFQVTPDPRQPHDYFLIEYRAAVGADHDLLSPTTSDNRNRLCVWHIDDVVAHPAKGGPNKIACRPNQNRALCTTNRYGVSLVQEDGNYSLEAASARLESRDCMGPNTSLRSFTADGGPTNYDLWPWVGTPVQPWEVRTGRLAEKATVTILINELEAVTPPEIVGAPGDAVRGRLWRYQPKITAPSGLPMWRLLKYPAGMTIDVDTGLVAWRVPTTFSGEGVAVEIEVANCGGSATQEIILDVPDGDGGMFSGCGCASRSGKPVDDLPILGLLAMWAWVRKTIHANPAA